jgi:hypothetical protein
MDYGLDISIFANGLPDTRSAGAQRLSSRPALDLTLSTVSDRDVLILDLYKLQFTPPELVFWSQDQNGEPAPITINLPDLLQDTVDRNTIADVTSQIETTVLADARYADIRIETSFTRQRKIPDPPDFRSYRLYQSSLILPPCFAVLVHRQATSR